MAALSPRPQDILREDTSILGDSFGGKSEIGGNVSQILGLISDEQRSRISAQMNALQRSADQLSAVVHEYLQKPSDYNFKDYGERLRFSDARILKILEEEYFIKNGEKTTLGEAFYDYVSLLDRTDKLLEQRFKAKVIKDFGLDRLVYEYLTTVEVSPVFTPVHFPELGQGNLETFLSNIRRIRQT